MARDLQPRPGMNVRADFDRIAALSPDHTSLSGDERWLLTQAPPAIDRALELGCGLGLFTRELARRARSVLALDLSPGMIERARVGAPAHVTFQVADALTAELPAEGFDCVASLATLHHLPLAAMLARMGAALRPGGFLLVQDLDDSTGLRNVPRNVLGMLTSLWRKRPPPELAAAWAEHCRDETYPTIAEVREAAQVLPGARVVQHLRWRYSLVWRKPR